MSPSDADLQPVLPPPGESRVHTLESPAQMARFGVRVGELLSGGELLALDGPLGAGKTAGWASTRGNRSSARRLSCCASTPGACGSITWTCTDFSRWTTSKRWASTSCVRIAAACWRSNGPPESPTWWTGLPIA
jgi:hypothetical protein